MVAVLSVAGFVSYTDRVILSAWSADPPRPAHRRLPGLAAARRRLRDHLRPRGLPLGRLADRTVRIRLIIAGSTTWCVGTIACGLAPSFAALFAARFVIGVGEAALAPRRSR
ncbi:MAG: hypothetical protein U0841_35325 [Chloroflexia bacterium]